VNQKKQNASFLIVNVLLCQFGTEGRLTFLPPQVIGQQLASKGLTRLGQLIVACTWEWLEQEY
jgi:hypothetical protein